MVTEKSGFNHKYNTDNVLIRTVIVGLINSLNEKIYFNNVKSDTEVQKVNVPFYYAFSGDERFMQDYFSDWGDCAPVMIEGNYDPIPRGSLTLTGTTILSGQLTSRFVRGTRVKEEEGQLNKYSSYLNSIPLNMTFSVSIIVDNVIDSFKITQELIRIFYKTLVFRVNYDGTVVPSQVGFPESYTNNKLFEYTYGENSRTTITFDLELETYFPIFDPLQEMKAKETIGRTIVNVKLGSLNQDGSVAEHIASTPENTVTNDGVTFQKFVQNDPNVVNKKTREGYWE